VWTHGILLAETTTRAWTCARCGILVERRRRGGGRRRGCQSRARAQPTFVLMDIKMPGSTVSRLPRPWPRQTSPSALLTAYSDKEFIDRAGGPGLMGTWSSRSSKRSQAGY